MTIEEQLLKLRDAKARLEDLIRHREDTYIFWNIWKYYAQKQSWYSDFIHEYHIPWPELKYFSKDLTGEIANDSFVSYEHGVKLWLQRKEVLDRIKATEGEIDQLLENLFCEQEVPLSRIAPYYGSSTSGVYNYMTDRPWFMRRKDKVK